MNYYIHCPTCDNDSLVIGKDNPKEVANLIQHHYIYAHGLHLLNKVLPGPTKVICETIDLKNVTSFFAEHAWCLSQRDFQLRDENCTISLPIEKEGD